MKRIMFLLVTVLGSALLLYAKSDASGNTTTDSGWYYACTSYGGDRAVDLDVTSSGAGAAGLNHQGNTSNIADEKQTMPAHIGRKMSAIQSADEQETESERIWFLYQLAP